MTPRSLLVLTVLPVLLSAAAEPADPPGRPGPAAAPPSPSRAAPPPAPPPPAAVTAPGPPAPPSPATTPGPPNDPATAPEHSPTPAPPAEPPATPPGGGRWTWPLSGRPRILRSFAPPPEPWLPGHRGVDLAAAPGAPVRAAGPGTIGYAGPLAGRGVVTVLHPGGLRTTYLPLRPSVRRGQTVEPGQVIGVVEDVPGHCPTGCLHWGLLLDRRYLDPLLLLGLGQVRLLPQDTPSG
ncbi:M23 family metallopeptidase [Planomonospora alba]|uniref:murein hydrolase activator EnvC family protein n=1 Tax=Planomonospora alba TaxID=161354 RepID=UPI0031F0C2E3